MEYLFKQKFLLYPACVINKISTNFKELKSGYKAINLKKGNRKILVFELKDESTTYQNL